MTEKNWSFSINDEKQINWQRLEADALVEGLDAFVVQLKGNDIALLVVRNKLLEKVSKDDNIMLADRRACESWGYAHTPKMYLHYGGYMFGSLEGYNTPQLHHYRCCAFTLTADRLDKIKTTLEALRNFKRKAVVKVSSI